MSRSKEELETLLVDLKGWHQKDMGYPYDAAETTPLLKEMLKIRLSEFLRRRIGHLRDVDFVQFLFTALSDQEKKISAKTKKA